MIRIIETSTRQKELIQTLTPLVQQYAKATSSPKAIFDLIARFAEILENWDYAPKEIKNLDRRAFTDLIKSWQTEAPAKDMAMIKAVF